MTISVADVGMEPELSIIVPVLNEAAALPELLASLARQRETRFEVVICDGGSTDGTADLPSLLGKDLPFPVRVLSSARGRALQMNDGAAVSCGDSLLFLHADSLFADPLALRTGLDQLAAEICSRGNDAVAARYALRFSGGQSSTPAFYHLECKARLNRPGCIHGDQGFLLRRSYFSRIGPFDPAISMLTETRLAEAVHTTGAWLLLPVEILTSPRRFLHEGLYQRQALNAILMNFAAIGWCAFFHTADSLYVQHDEGGPLLLSPLLRRIGTMIGALPPRERLALWYRTGAYVRANAWQLSFFLDTRRNFRRGIPPGTGRTTLLDFYERHLDRVIDHPPGRAAAALLTWCWFRLACRTKKNHTCR